MTAPARFKSADVAEGRVLLQGVSWATYERLLADHIDAAGPRFIYDDGLLEIMTVSIGHEEPNCTLASIVENILVEWDIDFEPAGSNTFKREKLKKGFEPDSSFYIAHATAIRGKKCINLAVDPPPDLVIEVEVTEPLLPRLPIFAAMRVPEIWVCEGETVRILEFEGDDYRDARQSPALAPLTARLVTRFLRQRRTVKRPAWARAVREWARVHRR
jgi:Uma2 family endonuclease